MKYSYQPETFGDGGCSHTQYEVRAFADHRVATCFVEENAKLVVTLLNRGLSAPHLALALDRLLNTPFAANQAAEVRQEAARALAEWEEMTKTSAAGGPS